MASISNNGVVTQYTYDANNNISTITSNGQTITYTYNSLDELVREDNQVLNKTIVYSYDTGGNILSKTEYPYTTSMTLGTATDTMTYTYGDSTWKDKLTSYNGNAITYDEAGNMLTYNGYTYTWEAGRQLSAISGNGQNISYKYNDSGYRTEKTVNGITSKYYLDGDKVVLENTGSDSIYYSYDADDKLVSMTLNGTEYFYIRNGQGDITGLIDTSGTQVVSYVYDSWGKVVSIDGNLKDTVGLKNPYRYRGYRYDTETGLYYLQSRYYNPEMGRYINADELQTLELVQGNVLGANLFVYCSNNPVINSDPTGQFGLPAILGVALTGAVIGAVAQLISNALAGLKGKNLFRGVLGAAIGTSVNATLLIMIPFYTPGKNLIAALAGGTAQAIFDFLENVLVWKTKRWQQFGADVILNAAVNAAGNYLGNKAIKINGGWFQPKYFKSIFTGSYGRKLIAQCAIGGVINGIANLIRKMFNV